MNIAERLLPKRLSARVWMITLPSAVFSFEQRSHVPKLPIGSLRYAGIPLIALGALLVLRSSARDEDADEPSSGPLSKLGNPATAGGLITLAGVGLLFRSLAICAYSLGLAVASSTKSVAIEEPSAGMLLGDD
jgi:hypothetical protein